MLAHESKEYRIKMENAFSKSYILQKYAVPQFHQRYRLQKKHESK